MPSRYNIMVVKKKKTSGENERKKRKPLRFSRQKNKQRNTGESEHIKCDER